MSNDTVTRILSDLNSLIKKPLENEGVYIYVNEENIYNVKCLIIGPDDTPYQGGFYFFDINFPKNYPLEPPDVKYMTQYNRIRFNPNLYTCGKVCLSILNTWYGPSWTPCNTLRSVLVSLLGLVFIKHPLTNEPGYENACQDIIENYDSIIEYENLRIATVKMLRNPPNQFEIFLEKIYRHYYENYEKYKNLVEKLKKDKNKKAYFSQIYAMKVVCDYEYVEGEMQKVYDEISSFLNTDGGNIDAMEIDENINGIEKSIDNFNLSEKKKIVLPSIGKINKDKLVEMAIELGLGYKGLKKTELYEKIKEII